MTDLVPDSRLDVAGSHWLGKRSTRSVLEVIGSECTKKGDALIQAAEMEA